MSRFSRKRLETTAFHVRRKCMLLRVCPASRWLLSTILFLSGLFVPVHAEENGDTTRDTLVYQDGDRVHGTLVQSSGGVIVFKSDRFGELRVKASDAVVIKAVQLAEPQQVKTAQVEPAQQAPKTLQQVAAAEQAEQDRIWSWARFSPAALTASVREFFGPWRGRVSFSNEIVSDTAHRNNMALETKLSRKFTRDTVDLTARYNYDQTNGIRTTDMYRGIGSWRHDFTKRQFAQYRPTIEWNRANSRKQYPREYVLLQQEFGYGVNLWSRPERKLRLGISENVFDIWSSLPGSSHTSRAVESLFDELELSLPWKITLTQRGVWYPVADKPDGWEDQIELNKKLSETLSVAVRHEIRRNNPDGASQDYTRLKLLLGLDF